MKSRCFFAAIIVALGSLFQAYASDQLLASLSLEKPKITIELSNSGRSIRYLTKVDGVEAFTDTNKEAAILVGAKLLAAHQAARMGAVQVRSVISQADIGKQQIGVYRGYEEVAKVLARPGQEKALETAFNHVVSLGRTLGTDSALAQCEFKLSKLTWMAKEGTSQASSVKLFATKILEITEHSERGQAREAASAK